MGCGAGSPMVCWRHRLTGGDHDEEMSQQWVGFWTGCVVGAACQASEKRGEAESEHSGAAGGLTYSKSRCR